MGFDFEGRVALVTGASRGIGERIARDLAAAGAELIVTATTDEPAGRLEEAFDAPTQFLAVDFTDTASTEAFVEQVRALDRLDVLINNAGTARHGHIESMTPEDWEKTNDVNLRAPFFVSQAAAEVMKRRQYGRIVNIASIWAHVSRHGRGVYAAAKFGLRGITLTAAIEWGRYNILANVVSPGFTLTDMFRQNYSETERAEMAARVPIGRLAEPADVSSAVLFLASDLNTYITGQCLPVDGGFTAM